MVSRSSSFSIGTGLVLAFSGLVYIHAQNNIPPDNNLPDQKIIRKKEELSDLKEEISSLEQELKTKTKKEKKTSAVLENYGKQSFLLNKLINRLKKEEQKKQKQVAELESDINSLKDEIESIRDNYSKYVVAVYKSGKNSEWADIFSSNSVQQALLRYKYLNEFSERRSKNLEDVKQKKEKLETEQKALNREVHEKELITKQKLNEKNSLEQKLRERKKILNSIRHDKKVLANELKLKKNSEARIRVIINKLLEQSLKKGETGDISLNSDNKMTKKRLPAGTANFSSFADLKGRMNWPVSGGEIVNVFGENRNKVLNTVTINNGIDIKTRSDNMVKAVAEGIVSAVEWIPGYGSVVIINHNEEYRTVYGHLSEIFVDEGDLVKEGQAIASVGEDLEGSILHFEIWNSRINQDPAIWLAAK